MVRAWVYVYRMSTAHLATDSEALERHAIAIAEALAASAQSRSNETELREDVHSLTTTAAEELFGLDLLKSTREQRAGASAKTGKRFTKSTWNYAWN